jgi:hypothetical protein
MKVVTFLTMMMATPAMRRERSSISTQSVFFFFLTHIQISFFHLFLPFFLCIVVLYVYSVAMFLFNQRKLECRVGFIKQNQSGALSTMMLMYKICTI